MTKNFDDFHWHDAELQNLSIDRSNPGNHDEIRIRVVWPDDGSTSTIVFYDCYAAKLEMNFGVIACESILCANTVADDPYLNILVDKWKGISVKLKDLVCYYIETASTSSIIRVYAKGFFVE